MPLFQVNSTFSSTKYSWSFELFFAIFYVMSASKKSQPIYYGGKTYDGPHAEAVVEELKQRDRVKADEEKRLAAIKAESERSRDRWISVVMWVFGTIVLLMATGVIPLPFD
jgi:hypothetical protein